MMPDPMRQFRCPDSLWDEAMRLAAERDVTLSQVLRRALKDFTNIHHERKEEGEMTNNWILQANSAKVWDVDRYAADHAGQTLREDWTIRQLGDEMHIGDWAAVWSAGRDGGIVAVGRVIGTVFDCLFVDDGYWINPPVGEDLHQVVPLLLTWLPKPIEQAELKLDPDFADALIVTMPGGKNPFRVTDRQRSAIERRLNGLK
jgi:hypothetical protein